ncbi:MAG: HAD hydrolase-like protein, partial [Paracoccaceae bacterium]
MPNPDPARRLVIFDVDGTLIDSQAVILAAMRRAFAVAGRRAPPDAATLGIVGLSLPQAMEVLAPG